jgi:uncharacterized membrane protein YedE/YeeE
MRIATIVGIILIGLGVLSLAYFASPIRFMVQETLEPQKMNPVPPILGGIALVGGIALLLAVRPRR